MIKVSLVTAVHIAASAVGLGVSGLTAAAEVEFLGPCAIEAKVVKWSNLELGTDDHHQIITNLFLKSIGHTEKPMALASLTVDVQAIAYLNRRPGSPIVLGASGELVPLVELTLPKDEVSLYSVSREVKKKTTTGQPDHAHWPTLPGRKFLLFARAKSVDAETVIVDSEIVDAYNRSLRSGVTAFGSKSGIPANFWHKWRNGKLETEESRGVLALVHTHSKYKHQISAGNIAVPLSAYLRVITEVENQMVTHPQLPVLRSASALSEDYQSIMATLASSGLFAEQEDSEATMRSRILTEVLSSHTEATDVMPWFFTTDRQFTEALAQRTKVGRMGLEVKPAGTNEYLVELNVKGRVYRSRVVGLKPKT